MRMALNLPYGVDPGQFNSELETNFSNNLPGSVMRRLASLLAIDYATRMKATPAVHEHLCVCVTRLQNYLGNMVIVDENFSSAMTLFTVAITPEKDSSKSKSTKEQEQSQDAAIEAVVSMHFSELSGADLATMKEVLKEMLGGKSAKEIFEFVNSDPETFKALVQKAAKEKNKSKEIVQFVEQHIVKIIQKQQKLNKSKGFIKGLFSKVAIGVGVAAVASAGLVMGGLALPALLIPAVAVSSRVFSKAAEKASNKVIESRPAFTQQKEAIAKLRSETLELTKEKVKARSKAQDMSQVRSEDLSKSLSQVRSQSKDKSKSKGRSI